MTGNVLAACEPLHSSDLVCLDTVPCGECSNHPKAGRRFFEDCKGPDY
jgi:hypothetical protein